MSTILGAIQGDCELGEAATDAIAKIEAMIPDQLRAFMANTALLAPLDYSIEPIKCDLGELRHALRNRLKVHFLYDDVHRKKTQRTVRPLSLAFFGPVWVLAAWCEYRNDFLTFRLDRMTKFGVTTEPFRPERGKTLHDFLKRPQTWRRTSAPKPNGVAHS